LDADRTEADVEAGARAGIAEMLLGGTTSFLDMYYFQDATARAAVGLGARGFLGWAVLDADKTTQHGDPVDNAAGFIRRWRGHPLIQPLPAPQGVYVDSEETWRRTRELADRERTPHHLPPLRDPAGGPRPRGGPREASGDLARRDRFFGPGPDRRPRGLA
ncbi:Amidohydrolase family, partial [mine drainage metagenome]